MRIILVVIIYVLLHGSSVADEVSDDRTVSKVENWTLIQIEKKKASVALREEKSKPKENPLLTISCYLQYHRGDGFDLLLQNDNDFKTKDPDAVDVMVSVDDSPAIGDMWFPNGSKLETVKPRSLIKKMISGKKTAFKI
jgi:hypothetical protein